MRPGENIIDTTVDAALANMRNDARQKQLDELINKNIELQKQQLKLQQQQYAINASAQLPEGAEPVAVEVGLEVGVEVPVVEGDAIAATAPAIEVVPSVPLEEEKKAEPDPFINHHVLYNSFERSPWYYALRWLWCGCFEPRYKITSSYVIGEEWHGSCCGDGAECCGPDTRCGCLGKNRGCICCCCGTGEYCCVRVTDSMAFENVDDVQRRQTCCYATIGCLFSCFKDMGDIHLMGRDESNKNGWVLKRIHFSKRIYNELTKIIQNTNGKLGPADAKKDGKSDGKSDNKQEKKQ